MQKVRIFFKSKKLIIYIISILVILTTTITIFLIKNNQQIDTNKENTNNIEINSNINDNNISKEEEPKEEKPKEETPKEEKPKEEKPKEEKPKEEKPKEEKPKKEEPKEKTPKEEEPKEEKPKEETPKEETPKDTYSITSIDGIGKTFKYLVCVGSGCLEDGTAQEIDENGTLHGYNHCKVNNLKINNIVKDTIGGKNYLFIYYEFTSTLLAGELGKNQQTTSCSYMFDVYNANGKKINNQTVDLLGYSKVYYNSFNTQVLTTGTIKIPLETTNNSIKIIVD